MLTQLIHNGVIVPESPPYMGLVIWVRGNPIQLTPRQEEMALAWVKKLHTDYVQDAVFAQNFMADFSAALGVEPPLAAPEIDFSQVIRVVEVEKQAKESLTPQERKIQAAARKAIRDELKERFGHAIVNDERMELGGYMVEPGGIFMGRGQHPLRGRWKAGAGQADITLNLSPDAPRPDGNWREIIWQPESLWIARWEDKLSGKLKYLWLSDTTSVKQQREAAKFDKATLLHTHLQAIRRQIQAGLQDAEPRHRMVAMACYLIDALCMRVGDEKDADEADTVGATTLRPEHVTLRPDRVAEFHFLGKDSVEWHKELPLPPLVYQTMQELIQNARPSSAAGDDQEWHPTRDLPQLFPDVSSRDVNTFLSRIQKGLSAKVFRTHHATMAVQNSLDESGVTADDPEYKKWLAVVKANLAAAILCNHTKKASANWEERKAAFQERQSKAQAKLEEYLTQRAELETMLAQVQNQADAALQAEANETKRTRLQARYDRQIQKLQQQTATLWERVQRAEAAVGKIEAQMAVASENRSWNLGTSLKSYIDPRIYHHWGKEVGYDVIGTYYPTTLRRKFAWVQEDEDE